MGTRRQARLNSFLVREISAIVRDIKTGDLGFVTITSAAISPDLRGARIFVSIFGDDAEAKRNLEILERARGFIRSRLGKVLGTRVVPQLVFVRDEKIANADEMSRLIAIARASDPHPDTPPAKETGDPTLENSEYSTTSSDEMIGDFPPAPANLT